MIGDGTKESEAFSEGKRCVNLRRTARRNPVAVRVGEKEGGHVVTEKIHLSLAGAKDSVERLGGYLISCREE